MCALCFRPVKNPPFLWSKNPPKFPVDFMPRKALYMRAECVRLYALATKPHSGACCRRCQGNTFCQRLMSRAFRGIKSTGNFGGRFYYNDGGIFSRNIHLMAEKSGFEPEPGFHPANGLANRPLRPLGYFSIFCVTLVPPRYYNRQKLFLQ